MVSALWPEPLTRGELTTRIRAARREWDEVVARVARDRLTEPGLPGGWSVKDVLGHIAWGLRENATMMRARRLVGSDLWRLDDDARNAIVVEENRSRPLDEIVREYEDASRAFVEEFAKLSDDDLNDPARWPEMPAEWRPWRIIYDPEHYASHARDLREWLARPRRP